MQCLRFRGLLHELLPSVLQDLAKESVVVQDKDFDVENSIFGVLPEPMKKMIGQNQMKAYWSDAAIARASAEHAKVAPVAEERKPLLQFMATECDFKLEHADGSFMDHLTFCRDYCAAHYTTHNGEPVSTTPLFIHSILGVGTNIFPMEAEKIPMLASVLTPDEMDHVQAFPSILRIVGPISAELRAKGPEHKAALQGIRFHRLIDNEVITLSGPQLWVQLNFHLCAPLPALPALPATIDFARLSIMNDFVQNPN